MDIVYWLLLQLANVLEIDLQLVKVITLLQINDAIA
jgi:hypothetical protein